MLCLSVALFPGAGVGCPLLSSRALWRSLRPLPCSSVCGLHCTGPTNARQSQWEIVISCAGGQVFLVCLGGASSAMRAIPVAAGCSMKEGSSISVSFWLRMPWSRGCWLSVTKRSVLFTLGSVHSCCRSVSSLWRTCCHSGGRFFFFFFFLWMGTQNRQNVWMWRSRSSLRGYCLGAVVPWFLATFHRFCVVAERALGWPGPARLDISLLPTWRLVLGPCFLVRRLPSVAFIGWPSWGFVYVSTFWNVVCIISWKYWIPFLQNLSFLLRLRLILSLPQLLASSCPGIWKRGWVCWSVFSSTILHGSWSSTALRLVTLGHHPS